MTTEQIAEALGLKEVEYQPSDQAGSNVYEKLWVNADESYCYGSLGEVEKWLASPDGEKAVRDKVRELWCEGYRCIDLVLRDNGQVLGLLDEMGERRNFIDAVESSAWLAALEFLWERKEK